MAAELLQMTVVSLLTTVQTVGEALRFRSVWRFDTSYRCSAAGCVPYTVFIDVFASRPTTPAFLQPSRAYYLQLPAPPHHPTDPTTPSRPRCLVCYR